MQRTILVAAFLLGTIWHSTSEAAPFQQGMDGTVSMELENYDVSVEGSGASFVLVTPAGASDAQAMQAPGNGQPRLDYQVNFTQSGTHYVYVRALGTSGGSNSLWLGFDGNQFQYNVNVNPLNSWQWEGGFVINVPAPGEYTVTVTRRESGTFGDKIVILTEAIAPTGNGPAESPRGSGNAIPQVTITAPADGGSFNDGDSINFTGTASDAEDGDLSANLGWASSLDGSVGSGASFSTSALSVGTHTITASVSDSVPQQGSDSISVTVQAVGGGGTGAFQQAGDGTVSMEMENFDANVEHSGTSFALVTPAGASSAQAMQAPGNGQPVLEYQVNFTQTGTHYVYVRALGTSGGSNSLWLGFNGNQFQYNVTISPLNSWEWEGGFAINVPAPGEYTLTMTRRETGTFGDKIVILTSPVTPTGTGPAESLRGGSNAVPQVTITAPADGSSFNDGDSINFTGTASDAEDGDLSASLNWISNLDGSIGSGASFSTSALSVGNHTITASVSDSVPQQGSADITVTVVDPTDAIPQVTITAPADGGSFNDGDSINFTGTASDAEDGDLSANLGWASSLDGSVGSGASFSTSALSVGTHTITASVSDSVPQQGSDSISVTVQAVGGGGTGAFQQAGDGTVSMEMENFDANVEHSGTSFALVTPAGASSAQAMQAPGNGQPVLEYQVNFTQTGTHYVYVRALGTSGGSNSLWLGFNGNQFQYNVTISPLNSWEWEGGFAINVPAPGEYTLTMTRRETGTFGDKIVILTSPVTPTGTGPAESLRGGSNAVPQVTITAPADGSSFNDGDSINFTGTASDAEDGDLSASLNWISNLDGSIGSGASFSTSALSVGNHTITASVSDSTAQPGNDSIVILVQAPGATTAGLPFVEPFDDTNLIDAANTSADWNTSLSLLTTYAVEPLEDTYDATSSAIDIGTAAESDHAVAVDDLDGDGDLDIVMVGNGADRYYLSAGGSTPFSSATPATTLQNSTNSARAVVLEDFDQDGHVDILVTRNSGSVANVLYYNNATSNPFSGVAPTDLGTNLAATGGVDVGDIDGDGDADLVIGHTASADEYHLNLGNRTFSAGIAIPIPLDNETRAMRLGDMDLDGLLDLVIATTLDPVLVDGELRLDVATGTDEGTFLYLNNGTATPFTSVAPTRISDDENKLPSNGSMDLGDVNGDGYLDVVVGNLTLDRLYLNNATGPGNDPFLGVSGISVSSDERNTQSVSLEDIDNDGDLDLIAANKPRIHGSAIDNVGTDRLYLNDATGTFSSGIDISGNTTGDSQSNAVADLDGDDQLDIVVADQAAVSGYLLNAGIGSGLPNVRQLRGHARSIRVDTETASIASVLLTTVETTPAHTSIHYWLSNNGGANWARAHPGIETTFVTAGTDLRWRAQIESRSSTGFPSIDSLSITLTGSGGGSGPFQQGADGAVSMEIENFDTSIDGSGASFALVTPSGASGALAMQAPGNGQPKLEYQVYFSQTGTHYVYVRGLGTSGGSNSLWLGFDSNQFQYNVNIGPLNTWQWEGGFVINVPATGEYTITITRRESGALGDKIVILRDAVTPTGSGPAESPRGL